MAVQEGAFTHVNGTTWISAEGTDHMMGVVIVKTTQDDFALVGAVIPIAVTQQHEVCPLSQVDPFGCKLKASG